MNADPLFKVLCKSRVLSTHCNQIIASGLTKSMPINHDDEL
jgi:hypothetical protein